VSLLSMITPSDFIADEMDRLTPTVTVFILDAAFSYDDDPTNIASDLSAFNNKLLSANQCVTACEQILRVDNLDLMVVTHIARNSRVSYCRTTGLSSLLMTR